MSASTNKRLRHGRSSRHSRLTDSPARTSVALVIPRAVHLIILRVVDLHASRNTNDEIRFCEIRNTLHEGRVTVFTQPMRINKFFTQQGICSRREADRLIQDGRVTINGRVAKLGDQIGHQDAIARDGQILEWGNTSVYIRYHKPVGVTSTTEPHVSRNIIDEIRHPARIFPVGRLDKDSSGLILLTNDGDVVNAILRAEHGHEREYHVETDHQVTPSFLAQMAGGVDILGKMTRPCVLRQMGPRSFDIVLTEGRNRQIRRMCLALGYKVMKLHRVRIMHISVDGLAPGEWKDLTTKERTRLFQAVGRPVEDRLA